MLHLSLGPDLDPPPLQKKTPGPPFGTNFGQETSGGSGSQHQSLRTSPEVLEMRQLSEHRPLSAVLVDTVDARLQVGPPQAGFWLGSAQLIHGLFAGRTTWRL